jgi:SAM-dependent methyltransferase
MALTLNDLDVPRLRSEVGSLYARLATEPGGKFHFHRGAEYAVTKLLYDSSGIAEIPASSTEAFAGAGNPHLIEALRAGETVLDVGCGSGTDLLLAARNVGPRGHAIGVDAIEEMLERCRTSIAGLGLNNVELRLGEAENLPADSASVDVVISNGVLNLVPDKERAFREIYRVLRPGGRLQLSDIVVRSALPHAMACNIDLWTG